MMHESKWYEELHISSTTHTLLASQQKCEILILSVHEENINPTLVPTTYLN